MPVNVQCSRPNASIRHAPAHTRPVPSLPSEHRTCLYRSVDVLWSQIASLGCYQGVPLRQESNRCLSVSGRRSLASSVFQEACVPHINQQLQADSISVLRQIVWFSPLGLANQDTAEKATMKMMLMSMLQLLVWSVKRLCS
jgi:hypothetical protein